MNKFKIEKDKTIQGRTKDFFRPAYYYLKVRWKRILELFFSKPMDNIKQIPIIINNFNRLTYLKQLIEYLEKHGYTNIYIIDNASTYPPLLEYYSRCPYKIFSLKNNIGYLALWQTDIYKLFYKGYYVYTDPDVLPVDECPDDFLQKFYDLLQTHKYSSKAGFSLKIDDIPEYFESKEKVIEWESQFWNIQVEKGVYEGAIDTTFALYRPFTKWGGNFYEGHLRTDFPYQLRHIPWYKNQEDLSEEDVYYITHSKTATHWTKQLVN